ncbi:MAG: DNA polymerase III subunit delta [Phycisphaerales bacterium]|nr:DNA polymerase III subunit delta [Phycisphaerales bacterium]
MKIKPVQALVGSDAFLQLREVENIASKLAPQTQRVQFDGESAEISEVLDELRSFAMFGSDSKIVIVRNGDELIARGRAALEKYVENPSPSGVLILRLNSLKKTERIAKLIEKNGQIVLCDPPRYGALPAWIIQHARAAHQLTMEPAAAQLLAEMLGDNLGRIDNELAKLALKVQGDRVLVRDVEGDTAFQREQEMWDLTNAMATGQTTEALRRWRRLVQLDSSAEFRATTWISMWLEDVRKVLDADRAGQNPQAALPAFKYRDFRVKTQFVAVAKAMGYAGTARAINLLAMIDKHNKSGIGQPATNIESYIMLLGMK